MASNSEDEKKKQAKNAARLVLVGIIIHVVDVKLRLNGGIISPFHIMAFIYLVYIFWAAKTLGKEEQNIIIALGIITYFIPLINLLVIIPEAIRATLVVFTPLVPIYIAMWHGSTIIQLVVLLYLLFFWIPLFGISLAQFDTLQTEIAVPWAIPPGRVLERTTEKISIWWYGTKETLTKYEKQIKGEPIEEDKEKEGKQVAQKEEKYAGVTLEDVEIEDESLEHIKNQVENAPFMVVSKIKVDSPTPITVELICIAEEMDVKQPTTIIVPEPGRLDEVKSDEKRIVCEYKKGLAPGFYNLSIGAQFNFVTKADVKQRFSAKKEEASIIPQETTKGPINIELLPSTKAGKQEPVIVITEKQEKIYGITKIANAWDGRIKEITKFVYLTPKGIKLQKIEGMEVKTAQCEEVSKYIPCYNEVNNVFSVEVKEKTLTLPKKREKELSTIFEIDPQFKLKPLPQTFSVIMEYSYELKKSYETFNIKKKTEKSETK